MNNNGNPQVEKKFNAFIVVISIAIPLIVAALFSVRLKDYGIAVEPLSFLPPIYATINGITAIILVCGVMAIRRGNRELHRKLMTSAIVCSVLFLIMYVAYHMTAESTVFADTNHDGVRSEAEKAAVGIPLVFTYTIILISHIFLSIGIIPLVLVTYVRALAERFDRHRKIAKIAYPLWLYVAVTGVIVYLMISPYYAH